MAIAKARPVDDFGPAADVAAGLELLARSPPLWLIGAEGWAIAVARARAFAERWDGQAPAAGWSTLELYGMHRRAPFARLTAMGAAWVLARSGGSAIAVASDAIVVATRTGGRLRIYRTAAPDPDAVSAWELVHRKAES
jgi:hypothetical protein